MSKGFRGIVPIVAICLLILACGYVHGTLTNRWSVSHALSESVAKLQNVPTRLGDWEGQDRELEPRHVAQAGISGYVDRRFQNGSDPTSMTVFLLCGRSGPMSVHPPDVCYQGIGYVMEGQPVREELPIGTDGRTVECLKGRFNKPDGPLTRRLNILWTWLGDENWQAPANPRAHFMGRPSLYKLYVIQELTGPESERDREVFGQFLQRLFPSLDKALLSKS